MTDTTLPVHAEAIVTCPSTHTKLSQVQIFISRVEWDYWLAEPFDVRESRDVERLMMQSMFVKTVFAAVRFAGCVHIASSGCAAALLSCSTASCACCITSRA